MDNWILILGWGSPIGIDIFLVLLGSMIFILAKADETDLTPGLATPLTRVPRLFQHTPSG